jgi:UDP-3-O-[3-hydroxymyristoyl] glucosamine N-acyltransferase
MFDLTAVRSGTTSSSRLMAPQVEQICGGPILGIEAFEYIDGVTTPDRLLPHRLLFVDRVRDGLADALNRSDCRSILVIATEDYRTVLKRSRLITSLPRLCFARAVERLFGLPGVPQTQRIDPAARIHSSVHISVGATVGPDSTIGEGTYIYPNVIIGPRVRIGRNCVIKSGTVIGQAGFGVYRDAANNPHVLPHVAGVAIGDQVEIGALNTVASGTIHPTVIDDWVKTDDQVHIAHNCWVGARTLVTACVELSGSVVVGADCWIGPNAAVRDGVEIGAKAFIGIAANVVSPVAAGQTVLGNPARPHPAKDH